MERVGQPEPLLLRATEVACLLNLGRSKVYELMAAGELPVVRIGGVVRVPRSDLETWIRSKAEVRR
jgi:excisionase family DNA binding protein